MESRLNSWYVIQRGGHQWPLLFFMAVLVLTSPLAIAGESTLERSEGAIGSTVGNYRLVDQDWEVTPLRSFAGKPVIISFMYIDCHGPCQLMNQSLADLRKAFKSAEARETVFLSITIDRENDTPGALKEYGRNFTHDFSRWRFLSTDPDTLEKMVADLGYQYKKDEMGFDHLNRITLIGPDGVVLRHFYGTHYSPADVEKSVQTAMAGKGFSSLVTRIINPLTLYCSRYDPVSKTFRVDYAFIASSVLQYLFILGTLGYLFRENISRWFRLGSATGQHR